MHSRLNVEIFICVNMACVEIWHVLKFGEWDSMLEQADDRQSIFRDPVAFLFEIAPFFCLPKEKTLTLLSCVTVDSFLSVIISCFPPLFRHSSGSE